MANKEKAKRGRDWVAVAAHFRRGGPMKHKNVPRGGAGPEEDVKDGLEEYQTDEQRHAVEKLFEATPEELGDAAVKGAERNEPCASGEGNDRDG